MFDAERQAGADQILRLARHIALELAADSGASIRVIGWIGSGGRMDWEYAVEIDGMAHSLEVDDSDLLNFARHERVQLKIAERIRSQMRYALEIA